jgi:hypothetical protein
MNGISFFLMPLFCFFVTFSQLMLTAGVGNGLKWYAWAL